MTIRIPTQPSRRLSLADFRPPDVLTTGGRARWEPSAQLGYGVAIVTGVEAGDVITIGGHGYDAESMHVARDGSLHATPQS